MTDLATVFQQFDRNGDGLIDREELANVLKELNPAMFGNASNVDALLNEVDDNQDGLISYQEFSQWIEGGGDTPREVLDYVQEEMKKKVRKPCKYGSSCCRMKPAHRQALCHPGDWDWGFEERVATLAKEGEEEPGVQNVGPTPESELQPPSYWKRNSLEEEFVEWESVSEDTVATIQDLLTSTFKEVTTRDRTDAMPKGMEVVAVHRIENSALWRKYADFRYQSVAKRGHKCTPLVRVAGQPMKTDMTDTPMDGRLRDTANETYLFHGTSPNGASGIAATGFDLSFAGSGAGTMYGDGVYLAECSSKSDEYAKDDQQGPYKGVFCLLLCRAVLGEVLKMTTGGEATHPMISAAIQSGAYNSVLGDREASVGTYREFVCYAEGQVYPEYVILYKRDPNGGIRRGSASVRPVVANGGFEEGADTDQPFVYQNGKVPGWEGADRNVFIRSGCGPWGGLRVPDGGSWYLGLQIAGSKVAQSIPNHTPGKSYALSFQAARRPRNPDPTLCVKVANLEKLRFTPPAQFQKRAVVYTAEEETVAVQFENVSASGDRTAFIDGVEVEELPSTIATTARKVSGQEYAAKISPAATVRQLKEKLAEQGAPPPPQQKLVLGKLVLEDPWVLIEHGVSDGAELTFLVTSPAPSWDTEWGLGAEHPALLRSYYAAHKLAEDDWLDSDEQVWEVLRKRKEDLLACKQQLQHWASFVHVWKDGKPTATLHASPGEQLQVQFKGWMCNKGGDGCFQQLVVGLDTSVAVELFSTVPGRGKDIDRSVSIRAPEAPGTYMLWRYLQLQYSMADAVGCFKKGTKAVGKWYPNNFLGWVVVE